MRTVGATRSPSSATRPKASAPSRPSPEEPPPRPHERPEHPGPTGARGPRAGRAGHRGHARRARADPARRRRRPGTPHAARRVAPANPAGPQIVGEGTAQGRVWFGEHRPIQPSARGYRGVPRRGGPRLVAVRGPSAPPTLVCERDLPALGLTRAAALSHAPVHGDPRRGRPRARARGPARRHRGDPDALAVRQCHTAHPGPRRPPGTASCARARPSRSWPRSPTPGARPCRRAPCRCRSVPHRWPMTPLSRGG